MPVYTGFSQSGEALKHAATAENKILTPQFFINSKNMFNDLR
jgi:hypothetical protein